MPLDFPNSPVDGQYYEGFAWDATAQVWRVRGGANKALGLSGGTAVTSGGFAYQTFTTSGTLVVTTAGLVEALLVGGGGGGGNGGGGGGGGGGGVKYYASLYLPAGSHTVTVGAGGIDDVAGSSNGKDSTIGNYAVAYGGGRGGGSAYDTFYPGHGKGSNGGGSIYFGNGSSQEVNSWNLANTGGNGTYIQSGGGGGGAGTAGANAPAGQTGGAGGSGTNTFSVWGLATTTGHNVGGTVWFGGGGSGGPYSSNTTSSAPGSGGGGQSVSGVGQDGLANTGGGGAGSRNTSQAGHGGSGVVIVRVAI
jgi:hypothetical protein